MALKLILLALLLVADLVAQVVPVLSTNGPAMLVPSVASDFQSQTTTVSTNWTQGKFYTNTLAREIEVSASITNTMAAVVGFSGMELWVGYSTNSATLSGIGATTTKTLLTGLATTQEMHLRGRVPIGAYFVFTNISSGSGNSVVMRAGSGQYTILP